jgi:hypothetical protein
MSHPLRKKGPLASIKPRESMSSYDQLALRQVAVSSTAAKEQKLSKASKGAHKTLSSYLSSLNSPSSHHVQFGIHPITILRQKHHGS